MTAVLVLRGAADPALLRAAAPDVPVVKADSLHSVSSSVPVSLLILRSGVHLGEPELQNLPQLRHVIRAGSGTDNIDLAALARRGIRLHRHAAASAPAVAEWALAAVLALARRIPLGHNALLSGVHAKTACLSPPLSEMTVGIWGAGPVGLAAGHALAPHAAHVAYAQWPSNPPGLVELPAYVLLERCHVHVIALPLRPETRGLVGRGFLNQMADKRPHLVCAGRLETLDLAACLHALAEGRLSGLAADAVEQEHVPLLQTAPHPLNLLLTPHIGAQRRDVRGTLERWSAALVRNLVHPQGQADPIGVTE